MENFDKQHIGHVRIPPNLERPELKEETNSEIVGNPDELIRTEETNQEGIQPDKVPIGEPENQKTEIFGLKELQALKVQMEKFLDPEKAEEYNPIVVFLKDEFQKAIDQLEELQRISPSNSKELEEVEAKRITIENRIAKIRKHLSGAAELANKILITNTYRDLR